MKKLLFLFSILVISLAFFSSSASAQQQDRKKLTCAFDVIAQDYKMTKTGLIKENMSFAQADFWQGIGISSVGSVTFSEIPKESEGYLTVGAMKVNEGQRVYAQLLGMLEFVPASAEIDRVSFSFFGDESTSGADIKCTLRFIDRLNYAPTVSVIDENRLELTSLSGKSTGGILSADDPEGDRVRFEIIKYPSHGVLSSFDMNSGRFVYVSSENYSGSDSFEYVAVDEYGNYTSPHRVDIRVESDRSGIVFSDMKGRADTSAATYVVSSGIMTASIKGGEYSFLPELKIKRAEFIMMALKAAGKGPSSDMSALEGIVDLDGVSEECRGYIAAALEKGYVSCESRDGGKYLRPQEVITKAEAARILSRLCGYEKSSDGISVFADFGRVDASYLGAISAMYSSGVIECSGGLIRPNEEITRESCAKMLYRFSKIS